MFISTLIHTIDGVKSRPQIPRGTKFVSLHEDKPREVNIVFVSQQLDPRGGGSNSPRPPGPLGPPRYFGLPMENLGRPPLPPNKPYHRPFNYLEYVKDFDPYAHVRIFKVAIRTNGETNDAKIVNLFSFTLKGICIINVTIIWENTQIVFLQNCSWLFVKGSKKFKMMKKFTYS